MYELWIGEVWKWDEICLCFIFLTVEEVGICWRFWFIGKAGILSEISRDIDLYACAHVFLYVWTHVQT